MSEPVLLITGASRGIGEAAARLAASSGYRVALLSRSVEALSALVDELGSDRAAAWPCDVTDWASLTTAIAEAESRFGRLDAVFGNAGTNAPTSFLDEEGLEPQQWRELVLTNVLGAALTARAALPALTRARGHLLLTGSNAGRGTRPGSLYSATKWAVTGMAQNIRAECVGTGVRVTLLQPGMVETDMTAARQGVPKLRAADVAGAALYALGQPDSVDVNEITIRPTGQDPER
ncbi:SDR family oxidoreductase [Salinifilum ghardaiensis]